jgi:cellulose synthase/poly-beta-1,6-N-acetylglucosamine synthase-like glycosyltransferase
MIRIAPALHPAFRVDVSRYPQVGLVVTVPQPSGPALTRPDFTVMVGATPVRPRLRLLSPGDIQLALAPDTHGAAALLAAERAAAARFLVTLPRGAQTGIVDPSRAILAGGLTGDPTASVARIAAPARGAPQSAAARLTAALSAFSRGARVRRTVVLVVNSDELLDRAAERRFRQQFAASGTALYVLDASPHGSAAYDTLAAGSGGFAARQRAPASWGTGLSQILTDLGDQYYLSFADPAPLPGLARIVVATPTGDRRSVAGLPAANPVAPRPAPPQPHLVRAPQDWPLVWLGILLIVLILCYGLGMLAASRWDPRRLAAARRTPAPDGSADRSPPRDLFFVFLLPCLNEEKVIWGSLQRLLSIPTGNFAVLVIDDGSDDDTVAVVSSFLGERAWLLRRTAPNARQGKGEALNAAIGHLTGSGLLDEHDPGNVIVVVVDADGRLDPQAITEVSPYFADPTVGAVQIGVRINNRTASRLARMQDMEFVIYTEVFQRGRRHLGSVGLGGNGQFMRLSALRSLGPAPWTRSLTEDLDLGIRLLAAGWRNEYCPAAAVHQQGVVQLGRLIRQRSRWFQGHLQSWKLIPAVLRSAPRRARADLLYHLSSPAILLIASLLSASFLVAVANYAVLAARGQDPFGWWLASTYALTFGPALMFSVVYWTRERHSGVPMIKVAGFAHLYVCYTLMWYAAGWWAVGRTVRRRTSWAKTDRVAEAPVPAPTLAGVPAAGAGVPAAGAGVPAAAGAQHVLAGAGAQAGFAEAPAPAASPLATSPFPAPAARPPATSPAPAPAASPPGTSPFPAPGADTRTDRPCGPGKRGRAGHKRLRAPALAGVAVLTCAALGTVTLSPGRGSRSQWFSVFNGYGTTSVTGSGAQQGITLSPGRAVTRADTHAALVLSKTWYEDFVAVTKVRTVRQLRRGAAGRPNPWEVGWVIWHYTANQRFYALTLEPTGWVLSKQDPAFRGGERFLASGQFPRFRVGVPHDVGIVQIGNGITVSADGHRLAQFTDTQRPYLTGAFGVYSEDSVARFWRIRLNPLPGSQAPSRPRISAPRAPLDPVSQPTIR